MIGDLCRNFDERFIKARKRYEKYLRWAEKAESEKPFYGTIISDLAHQVFDAIGDDSLTLKVGGPSGICARWHVFIDDQNGKIVWFAAFEFNFGQGVVTSFKEGERTDSSLFVRDYSQKGEDFPENSIGALNGMNHPAIPINDWTLEQLVEWGKVKDG